MTLNFGELWQNANPDALGGNDTPPPDGVHDVALIDAEAFTKREDPSLSFQKMRWQLISDAEYEWDSFYGHQKQANIAKRETRELGIDIDSIDSLAALDAALRAQVGTYYRVEVTRSKRDDGGEWVNTYVRGLLTPEVPVDAPQPVAAGGGTAADDDVPFLWQPAQWEDRYHSHNRF